MIVQLNFSSYIKDICLLHWEFKMIKIVNYILCTFSTVKKQFTFIFMNELFIFYPLYN